MPIGTANQIIVRAYEEIRPTDQEIAGCPEIIVRLCPVCERELWWNVDAWRKV